MLASSLARLGGRAHSLARLATATYTGNVTRPALLLASPRRPLQVRAGGVGFGAVGKASASSAAPSSSAATAAAAAAKEETETPPGTSIYEAPQLYDDAFSYRDFEAEAQFMVDAYSRYTNGAKLTTSVELGCGPANHSLALARRGVQAWGIDSNAAMLAHAAAKAAAAGVALRLLPADMRSFLDDGGGEAAEQQQLRGRADLALCPLGTLSHLLDNASAAAAFQSAAAALRPGGVFVLELAHPGDLFDGSLLLGGGGDEVWEVEAARSASGRKLLVNWGSEMDAFDAETQVLRRAVTISALEGDAVSEVLLEEVVPYRQFTAQEVGLLAAAAGLEVRAFFGEMALDVGLGHEEAYRLVACLQKPE